MNKTVVLWTKAALALLAICTVVVLAASDVAPFTPVSTVLAYALVGAALFGVAVLAVMWLKFLVNQFLLNAGATDTQWLWFKSDPRGLDALRSQGGARQSYDAA